MLQHTFTFQLVNDESFQLESNLKNALQQCRNSWSSEA